MNGYREQFHRKDAKSTQKGDELAHNPLTIRLMHVLDQSIRAGPARNARYTLSIAVRLLGSLCRSFAFVLFITISFAFLRTFAVLKSMRLIQ